MPFNLDITTEVVFRINYGGILDCARVTSSDIKVCYKYWLHGASWGLDKALIVPLYHMIFQNRLFDEDSLHPDVEDSQVLSMCRISIWRNFLGSQVSDWKDEWNVFLLVTVFRNGFYYILRDIEAQKDDPQFQGTLNLEGSVDKYIKSVIGLFRTQPHSRLLRHFIPDFQPETWGSVTTAILEMFLQMSTVYSGGPFNSFERTFERNSFPPTSAREAKTLSNIAWKELPTGGIIYRIRLVQIQNDPIVIRTSHFLS